jgi:mRNA-degrading endonuclease RelE of RelBE toxin-antitoxin system
MKIELAEQVREFLRTCPPEPRRWLRDALRKLTEEKGDIKVLEGELAGYYRLRVRSYRVIFRYDLHKHDRIIRCDFAEHRGVVYEAFMRVLGD